jgi:hypothetical protein
VATLWQIPEKALTTLCWQNMRLTGEDNEYTLELLQDAWVIS